MSERTIAAISTPYGRGGVAMIRVSGERAIEVCNKVFSKNLFEIKSNHAVHGEIFHGGEVIDDGIIVIYRAPHSYTGDDTVEIMCHGGILLTQLVLESVIENGAELAEAGEFTQRAFMNGKLGLIGVESVIDSINAESREKLKLAKSTSTLSKKIAELYDELKILLSSIYVYIDYPDEDLEDVQKDSLSERLNKLCAGLNLLMQTYRTGRAINEGILTVICGKPNTGKSSLLNRLVGADKAIVTEIPGTTRDIIEETISAGKILLRLCDTAGIRQTDDTVEVIGVNRAIQRLDEAELVLIVFDISEELDSDDFELIKKINGNVIAILNKSDLPAKIDIEYIKNTFPNTVTISAVNGEGIMELLQTIEKMYAGGEINYNETAILRNLRQYTSVKSAFDAVSEAVISLETGYTQDVVGLDLEIAMAKLGEIDGRAVSEDIVHEIFSRFCVGK